MKNKNIFSIVIVIIFLIIVFFLLNQDKIWTHDVQVKNFNINKIEYLKITGKTIKVDLALTSKAQEQGLSGRKELKEDEGMLFVFEYVGKYAFWIKDMNFPIDIIWISSDLHVIYIKKNATPESYPETFTPTTDAKYILEVKSSFSEKNNLKVGDKVEFLPS